MRRAVACTLMLSFSTLALGADTAGEIVLPVSMKGESDYQGRVRSTWSLQVTKASDDGTFEGLLTYAGRACNADRAAITDGTNRGGVVRFKANMGPKCSENVFTLRRGTNHALEGEVESNVAPGPARVWLDPAP